jgi:hypothetical protein
LDESLLPQKLARHFLRVAMLAVDGVIESLHLFVGDFSRESREGSRNLRMLL